MSGSRTPRVSIVIKALNEERKIAAAIESAIAALQGLDGEVILADCASTDRTIEVARRYPITIVRLGAIRDRGCGAGAQLGFQYSRGQYVWLMDGDMRLHGGFLPAAIRYLAENPAVAGVGGMIVENEKENLEFVKRASSADSDRAPGPVDRLDGGGVYRRAAIESVGYLGDRNLHAAEEADLGARLLAHGWRLARLDRPAAAHEGHPGNAYRLLLYRVATRMASGSGELLRAAIGRPHFRFVVAGTRAYALWPAVHVWWLCMLAAPVAIPGLLPAALAVAALLLLPASCMALRCRSIKLGLYSVAAWNVYALAFWPGFLRRRIAPTDWIDSSVVQYGRSPARRCGGRARGPGARAASSPTLPRVG